MGGPRIKHQQTPPVAYLTCLLPATCHASKSRPAQAKPYRSQPVPSHVNNNEQRTHHHHLLLLFLLLHATIRNRAGRSRRGRERQPSSVNQTCSAYRCSPHASSLVLLSPLAPPPPAPPPPSLVPPLFFPSDPQSVLLCQSHTSSSIVRFTIPSSSRSTDARLLVCFFASTGSCADLPFTRAVGQLRYPSATHRPLNFPTPSPAPRGYTITRRLSTREYGSQIRRTSRDRVLSVRVARV